MTQAVQMREIGGHVLPYSEDTAILGRPVRIPGSDIVMKNAIVSQPLEGCDSTVDGAPGELTRYRYRRFLDSGVGLIWLESLAAQEEGRSNQHALWITDSNVDAYKAFIDELKSDYPEVPIVAQLTHSGRFSAPKNKKEPIIATYNPHHNARVPLPEDYPVVTDEYLDRTIEAFAHAAALCEQAGFDGVDVKACHGYLFSELLCAYNRPGRFGGSFENRARMLLETVEAVKAETSNLLVATRICHADTIPYPYGFGMKQDGSLDYDQTELFQLVDALHKHDVNLVNVSVGRVTVNREFSDLDPDSIPKDTNADLFNRFFQGTKALAHAFPDMCFVGSGYTLLREDTANVAAGALAAGDISLVGFGRMALAYPGFATDIIAGTLDSKKLCTICGNCYKLLRAFAPTGCPTRDRDTYLPQLQEVLGK